MSEPNRTKAPTIEQRFGQPDGSYAKFVAENPSDGAPPVICWSCKKPIPITEKLDLDLATVPNRGEPMCGACRGQHCD